MIVRLDSASELIRRVARLVDEDPIHGYLLYSAIYEPSPVGWINLDSYGNVAGYALLIRKMRSIHAYLWGEIPQHIAEELARELRKNPVAMIHVCTPTLESFATRIARELFNTVIEDEVVDMIVTRSSFREYAADGAIVRALDPRNENDVASYAILERDRGVELDESEARVTLSKYLCFAAFVGNEIASIACSLVRLCNSWIVEDVFTRPAYRGRGLGKAALSGLVSIGVVASSRVIASVRASCPARRMYRRLGFEDVRTRRVLICSE